MSDVTSDLLPGIKVWHESDKGTELFKPRERPKSTVVEANSSNQDLFARIYHLVKDSDKIRRAFVPENSLEVLFKDPNAELSSHVLKHLNEDEKLKHDIIVSFICEKAPKVYATLVFSNAEHLIMRFWQKKMDDTLLPVVEEEEGVVSVPAQARLGLAEEALSLANQTASELDAIARESGTRTDWERHEEAKAIAEAALRDHGDAENAFNSAAETVKETFHLWDLRDIVKFCESEQWRFVAPVFSEAQFNYKFHESTRMPFLRSESIGKQGRFSRVRRVQLHRNHLLQNDNQMLVSTDADHPWVVEKMLTRNMEDDNEFERSYQFEGNALKAMKELKDPHLIRTIASYSIGKNYYFMFPWAESGCLRDYWETSALDRNKRLAPPYLKWVFTQLRGVTNAIKLLHRRVIRHGDLKPENILCFPSKSNGSEEGPCTLVIADAGLSKIHHLATHLRNKSTEGPKGATAMYEPPDSVIHRGGRTSRRFDVWSLGCICLEFLVWLAEGQNGLNEFHSDVRPFRAFYESIYGDKNTQRVVDAKPHPHVVRTIESLRNKQFFQGKSNPLSSLVGIIEEKMLVVPLDLDSTKAPAGRQPGTLQVPQQLTRTNRAMTINDSKLPEGARSRIDEILHEFKKILETDDFNTPSTALDGSEDVQPSTPTEPEQSEPGESPDASGASGATASRKSSTGSKASWRESLGVRRRRH